MQVKALSVLLSAGLAACASGSRDTEYVRSPSLDYGREPPRTSDNRIVGADNVDPHDRLQEGAQVGRPNELSPGWTAGEAGVVFRPEHKAGGYGASAEEERETQERSSDAGAK
jgi:hypothetical protein